MKMKKNVVSTTFQTFNVQTTVKKNNHAIDAMYTLSYINPLKNLSVCWTLTSNISKTKDHQEESFEQDNQE